MKSRLDYIIEESINNLLLEEFGVIGELEPLADFILDRLFAYHSERKWRREGVKLSMNFIINHVNCKKWYSIDKIRYIILNTTSYDEIAKIDVLNHEELIPEIVIDASRFDWKMKKNIGGNAKEIFFSMYKPSIMHELTHLVEVVNTWEKGFKSPAYTYMADYPIMCDVSCAFSKTELNARINTIYYEVLNNRDLIDKINTWSGSRNQLCKYIIDSTRSQNWVRTIETIMGKVKNAIKGDKKDIDFVKEFIDINRESAFYGSKNVFKFKWGKDPNDSNMITRWNDSDENVIEMAKKLYNQMNEMYNTYLRKLYNAVNNAIDKVKNEQTSQL